jgi:hypothetical protein
LRAFLKEQPGAGQSDAFAAARDQYMLVMKL